MKIFLRENGENSGPYTLDQVNESLVDGSLKPTCPAWHDALPDWIIISQIEGVVVPVTPAPPPFNPDKFSPNEPPDIPRKPSGLSENPPGSAIRNFPDNCDINCIKSTISFRLGRREKTLGLLGLIFYPFGIGMLIFFGSEIIRNEILNTAFRLLTIIPSIAFACCFIAKFMLKKSELKIDSTGFEISNYNSPWPVTNWLNSQGKSFSYDWNNIQNVSIIRNEETHEDTYGEFKKEIMWGKFVLPFLNHLNQMPDAWQLVFVNKDKKALVLDGAAFFDYKEAEIFFCKFTKTKIEKGILQKEIF